MKKTAGDAVALIDKYLDETRAEKRAALGKAATDPSDPTSQPVMKADDGTVPGKTGARAAENDADIRKDYGSLGSTGQTDANNVSAPPSDSIGTQKMDADEIKGNVQTPKATLSKPTKPTGGGESPDHPSNATFSEKYSSVIGVGNNILQKLAGAKPAPAATTPPVKAANDMAATVPPPPPTPPKKKEEGKKEEAKADDAKMAAAKKYPDDAAAGYMAAEALFNEMFGKQASEEDLLVQARAEELIKDAEAVAVSTCSFMKNMMNGAAAATKAAAAKPAVRAGGPISKKAEGAMIPPEALEAGAGGGGGALPPELAAAAGGGGGGMPPEMAGGGGGGMPPEMAGGMPPEGGGGMPPDVGGGGGDSQAKIDEIAQALDAAGVTPEELAAAIAEAGDSGGGEGGGMPPEVGGGGGGGGPPAEGGGDGGPQDNKEKSEGMKEEEPAAKEKE